MDSDVQVGVLARQRYCMIERWAGGHKRSRGQDPVPVRVHDTFVDVACKAEIIGVRDEVFQNRPSLILRNFFGLVRKSRMSPCSSRVAPFKLSYNCWLTK